MDLQLTTTGFPGVPCGCTNGALTGAVGAEVAAGDLGGAPVGKAGAFSIQSGNMDGLVGAAGAIPFGPAGAEGGEVEGGVFGGPAGKAHGG